MWKITYEESKLVRRHRGTLPVILSCPHDGTEIPSGVPERTGGDDSCPPFRTDRDLHTSTITEGIAQRILNEFGEAPYVVVADFSRKHIDANRPSECAYEVEAAREFYDEYHDTLRRFVNELRAENGGLGLLFDIHGTRVIQEDPADLYLGTDNGKTIQRLQSIDAQVLWRRRSLRGFLGPEGAGYVVSPKQPGIPENPAVDGGHTVRSYGSSHADGVDAIQIEIASTLRTDSNQRKLLIENLANAIGNLVTRYADARTLSAFGKASLSAGDLERLGTGQMRYRSDGEESILQLGGSLRNRGRVEIRHDPGGVINAALIPARPGVLVLYDKTGQPLSLWFDNQGRLRISSAETGPDTQVGAVVATEGSSSATRPRRRRRRWRNLRR